jgi:hypothetical protein
MDEAEGGQRRWWSPKTGNEKLLRVDPQRSGGKAGHGRGKLDRERNGLAWLQA